MLPTSESAYKKISSFFATLLFLFKHNVTLALNRRRNELGCRKKKKERDTICREDYLTPLFLLHKELEGKPEGKKPHGRPRGSWEDDIIMDLQ